MSDNNNNILVRKKKLLVLLAAKATPKEFWNHLLTDPFAPLLIFTAADESGRTMLHAAAWFGNHDMLKTLLQIEGIPKNARDCNGRTPLSYAVYRREGYCWAALLEANVEVNAADATGLAPLHIAALLGDSICLNALIVCGANVGATERRRSQNALHMAASVGSLNCVKILCKAVVVEQVDATDRSGATALSYAIYGKHWDCARELIRAGAKISRVHPASFGSH